jgi:hypothetical protein
MSDSDRQQTTSPCVSFGDDEAVNSCDQNKSFTIRWSGNGPVTEVTYRINENGKRAILDRDTQGVIVSEGAFEDVTNNPEVDLIWEEEQGSPDQKMLKITNPHDHYVAMFLEVEIWRGDTYQYACSKTRLIKPKGFTRACSFNNDYRLVFKTRRGEQDPD